MKTSNKADKVDNQSPNLAPSTPQPDNRRWLVAYTRMHHEKKVRDKLIAMNIECFLPIQTEIRQWSDRKKKVERVLISMMIFVYVNAEEQRQVLELPAVLRYMVLRGEHTPSEIPASQMDSFRFMVDNSQGTVNFNADCLQLGQEVRVIKGPLMGLTGKLVNIKGKSSIAIRIDALGFATVEIDGSLVEKV